MRVNCSFPYTIYSINHIEGDFQKLCSTREHQYHDDDDNCDNDNYDNDNHIIWNHIVGDFQKPFSTKATWSTCRKSTSRWLSWWWWKHQWWISIIKIFVLKVIQIFEEGKKEHFFRFFEGEDILILKLKQTQKLVVFCSVFLWMMQFLFNQIPVKISGTSWNIWTPREPASVLLKINSSILPNPP